MSRFSTRTAAVLSQPTPSPHIHVEFESSYEGTGPFGAKSIGEVVINTPGPAIAHAIYNATGHRYYELPITPEQIAMPKK